MVEEWDCVPTVNRPTAVPHVQTVTRTTGNGSVQEIRGRPPWSLTLVLTLMLILSSALLVVEVDAHLFPRAHSSSHTGVGSLPTVAST